MRTVLTFVGVAAIAVLFWFLRGSSDASILAAKDAQLSAMQETVRAKDDLATGQNATLTALQEKLKPIQDQLAKAQSQIEFDKAELQRVKNADATIISSLKEDNNADIQALKEQIQDKDEQIGRLNEKLVQTIADYEGKLKALGYQSPEVQDAIGPKMQVQDDNWPKIYPKDNGFELQDVGTGFFSYRYFSDSIRNPTNAQLPPNEPNRTPWVFTKDAGVAANGCGFCVTNAANGDSDGKTSTLGQAAFLEFQDSAVSQDITLPSGTFSVTFSYEARRNYSANEIEVSIDGTVLFRGSPTDTENFMKVTTDSIKLSAGKHTLKLLALGDGSGGGFPCTFIDDVSINVLGAHNLPKKKLEDKAAVSKGN